MAITNYPYTISTAFPTGNVAVTALQEAIEASAITIALSSIDANIDPDICNIRFVDPLPAPDLVILDAIVATHPGFGLVVTMGASTNLADADVIEDATWQTLGGVVTTPEFFTQILTQLFGRVVMQVNGDGGQLRVLEQVTGQADAVIASFNCPNTAAAWVPIGFSTSTPRAGYHNTYLVQGRLNGATALEVRFGTMSLLIAVPYTA